MTRLLSILLFSLIPTCIFGQLVEGIVLDPSREPVEGAKVFWAGTEKGTLTNAEGFFSLPAISQPTKGLVVVAVGYNADTIRDWRVEKIEVVLVSGETEVVEIRDNVQGVFLGMDPHKTEVITRTELEKDACCDLAGCFNTQASVEARTTNIVTNSKELQILGLSGVYNQLLLEGLPMFRGLSYTYGISGVPGPAIEKLFVSKGTGSVMQGAEGVTGQINVIPLAPSKADKLHVNVYGNSFAETQYNVQAAVSKQKWGAALALHSAQPGMPMDRDGDNFRDMPWLRRYHALGKLVFGQDDSLGVSGTVGFRLLQERRIGGQVDSSGHQHSSGEGMYIQETAYNQPEVWTRIHYRQDNINKSSVYVGLQSHDQASNFGNTEYDAKQKLAYVHVEHAMIWREKQQAKFGLDYRHLELQEDISFRDTLPLKTYAGRYDTQERIPGMFLENTSYLLDDRITIITGVRADLHNTFGWFVNPRALIRYVGADNFSVRFTAGSSYRTPLLFSENIGLLASGRDIIFEESIKPERAINTGINVDRSFSFEKANGRVGLDVYKTFFMQQFFPDYDRDPGKAFITNFNGRSEGMGIQVETNWELFKQFSVRVAYNYLDVFRQQGEDRVAMPFISNHKLMGAFSIWTKSRRLHFDTNWHWYGKQRMPDTENHPAGYTLPAYSRSYVTGNMQIAWKVDKKGVFDIYSGCENIFDFRQFRPIAGWQDPFSSYFDPSFAWGPTRGREIYAGIRLRPFAKAE